MLTTLLILWLARSNRGVANHQRRNAVAIVAICTILMTCIPTTCPIPTTCLGGDGYVRGFDGRGFAESRTHQDSSSSETQSENQREQLREGTLIPPMAGQIVLLGRRWVFVPAGHQSAREDDLLTVEQRFRAPAESQDSNPHPNRLGDVTEITAHASAPYTPATLVPNDTSPADMVDLSQPHLVVVENLMLQRIVEAIRAEASDHQWTVSGEVTEFFKENRLLIHTAQRANSN